MALLDKIEGMFINLPTMEEIRESYQALDLSACAMNLTPSECAVLSEGGGSADGVVRGNVYAISVLIWELLSSGHAMLIGVNPLRLKLIERFDEWLERYEISLLESGEEGSMYHVEKQRIRLWREFDDALMPDGQLISRRLRRIYDMIITGFREKTSSCSKSMTKKFYDILIRERWYECKTIQRFWKETPWLVQDKHFKVRAEKLLRNHLPLKLPLWLLSMRDVVEGKNLLLSKNFQFSIRASMPFELVSLKTLPKLTPNRTSELILEYFHIILEKMFVDAVSDRDGELPYRQHKHHKIRRP